MKASELSFNHLGRTVSYVGPENFTIYGVLSAVDPEYTEDYEICGDRTYTQLTALELYIGPAVLKLRPSDEITIY